MELVIGPNSDKLVFQMPKVDLTRSLGIMLSGGLDSSILLMLLNEFVPSEQIHIFTVPRADNAYYYATELVKSINQQYQTNFRQPCMVSNGQGFHGAQVWKGIQEVLSTYSFVDILYLAENIPPDKSQIEFNTVYPVRARSSNIHHKIKMPFWHLKKYHIIDIARQFRWLDLLNYTHSCCVQAEGRCGNCFNCLEREWAILQLNLTDTGKI